MKKQINHTIKAYLIRSALLTENRLDTHVPF
jgi:hypothetical protein